ncbi:MAG TPA: hypothetical protein VMA36_11040 [Candidatus Limnocylindria bacterium]|nr:hypothetical protein [Candidatus Limnocylindria bacterium]
MFLVCAGLAACNQNPVPTADANAMFQGKGDVTVLEAHIVPTGESSPSTGSGASLAYVMARIEYTNDTGNDIVPQVSDFYLMDRSGNRYQAHDSGSSVFTGISNSQDILAKNQKRVYTFGFRTSDPNISGVIFYER